MPTACDNEKLCHKHCMLEIHLERKRKKKLLYYVMHKNLFYCCGDGDDDNGGRLKDSGGS